jgi:hypothetical protein
MLRSVEDCWRTAAGGHVTQLVEDGGRLIELPVGGGVGKAKEGSGREGKEDGDVVEGGARECNDPILLIAYLYVIIIFIYLCVFINLC